MAQKMSGFGVTILTHDPFIDPQAAEANGATLVSMEKLFAESDFISVHTPLTKETHHLIGSALLDRMKPTSFLVNTSRGPVTVSYTHLDVYKRQGLSVDSRQ